MKKAKNLKPIYDSVYHSDFRSLINYAAMAYDQDDAFIIKHRHMKEVSYEHISFSDFKENINALGTGLLNKGLKGKRFAIIGKNRYEWILSYFAITCGLGICIPLDKGLPTEETESSLERSYADVLIFDKSHIELVRSLQENPNNKVTEYICMDSDQGYTSIAELMEGGRNCGNSLLSEYKSLPIDPDALAIILFTSGTTSMSKAVMLSQSNITSNIYEMLKVEDIRHGDINMAFLPYHHTFGSTGQILMVAAGSTTTYCDGLKYLQKNIVEYKVSVFVCVPLLIESIYKKIMTQIKKQGKEKAVAKGLKISRALMKLGIDVRKKVFRDIHDQLGGNLRYVISGASAIDPVAIKGFNDFGITAVQGYGMTEASPVLAAENIANRRAGSIGKAIPGVELCIIDENSEGIGELIARGKNIMAGYYENEKETSKVLTNGWLHTGDLASIDKDGFVFIRGRKKNVIVLKNGKNVYPEEIELLISALPYVEENMVFGQPRHKDGDHKDLALCAKIVYKPDYIKKFYGVDTPEEIEKIVRADLDTINEELPSYKQILRLIVTDQPMVKTTTGKVKRYAEK